MKKLMIAAAIVCAAAFAQAATVAWGGAISQPDGETELAANTMAYLVYASSAIAPAAGATFDGTTLKNGDMDIATMVSSHNITGDEATNWNFGETYAKAGEGVDGFYAVLISDNGENPMYSFFALDEVSGTTAASQPTDRQVTWESGSYLTQGGYTIASQAVPEPTSGLLLLLGVAGLALRRRRA